MSCASATDNRTRLEFHNSPQTVWNGTEINRRIKGNSALYVLWEVWIKKCFALWLCRYIYIYIYMCVCVCVCIYMYIYMYIYVYIPSPATTALSTLCQGRLYPHIYIYKYIFSGWFKNIFYMIKLWYFF